MKKNPYPKVLERRLILTYIIWLTGGLIGAHNLFLKRYAAFIGMITLALFVTASVTLFKASALITAPAIIGLLVWWMADSVIINYYVKRKAMEEGIFERLHARINEQL